jgi:hypothetical protein
MGGGQHYGSIQTVLGRSLCQKNAATGVRKCLDATESLASCDEPFDQAVLIGRLKELQ